MIKGHCNCDCTSDDLKELLHLSSSFCFFQLLFQYDCQDTNFTIKPRSEHYTISLYSIPEGLQGLIFTRVRQEDVAAIESEWNWFGCNLVSNLTKWHWKWSNKIKNGRLAAIFTFFFSLSRKSCMMANLSTFAFSCFTLPSHTTGELFFYILIPLSSTFELLRPLAKK